MKYLLARLSEGSTWRGLILLATMICGYAMESEKIEEIVTIGLSLTGLVGVFFPEKRNGDDV